MILFTNNGWEENEICDIRFNIETNSLQSSLQFLNNDGDATYTKPWDEPDATVAKVIPSELVLMNSEINLTKELNDVMNLKSSNGKSVWRVMEVVYQKVDVDDEGNWKPIFNEYMGENSMSPFYHLDTYHLIDEEMNQHDSPQLDFYDRTERPLMESNIQVVGQGGVQ